MAAHLTGIYSAIKMLNGRIKIVYQYLLAVQRGRSVLPLSFYFILPTRSYFLFRVFLWFSLRVQDFRVDHFGKCVFVLRFKSFRVYLASGSLHFL